MRPDKYPVRAIARNDVPFQVIGSAVGIRTDQVETDIVLQFNAATVVRQRQHPGDVRPNQVPSNGIVITSGIGDDQSVVTGVPRDQVALHRVPDTVAVGTDDIIVGTRSNPDSRAATAGGHASVGNRVLSKDIGPDKVAGNLRQCCVEDVDANIQIAGDNISFRNIPVAIAIGADSR